MGTDQWQVVYTSSLNFRWASRTNTAHELAVGHLDDHLILSFGMWDRSSHFAEVTVAETLKDHDMCEDLILEYVNYERVQRGQTGSH